MIVEEKISNLDNKPPQFKKLLYPVPNDPNVQKPYFICCAIGQRGSGKTYAIVKMLKNQEKSGFKDPVTNEKVDIRSILFSPTFKGNPIFTALKYLDEEDIINEYTDQKLYDVLENIKKEREETEKYQNYKKAYNKFSKMTVEQIQKANEDEDYEALALLAKAIELAPDDQRLRNNLQLIKSDIKTFDKVKNANTTGSP